MSEQKKGKNTQRIPVRPPADVRQFVPEFLEHRHRDISDLYEAIEKGDYYGIASIGHNMKGTARAYGFEGMTQIGADIESAGKERNFKQARIYAETLSEYLGRIEIVDEAGASPKRILVAEDAKDVAEFMGALLERKGYQVSIVENGEQCLRAAREQNPDLILLDIMMPGIHGIDILKRLKGDPGTAAIGVIICSAKSYKPEQDLTRQLGAFDFMVKPFAAADLIQKVADYFAGNGSKQHDKTGPSRNDAPRKAPAPVSSKKQEESYLRFWGTRGSSPVSGKEFAKYGGNTSCVEVRSEGELIVLDAGTGIRELGLQLIQEEPRRIHLLIGHTHWDHIQGFPFFSPVYDPNFEITIYGASGFGKDLRSIFQGQLESDYFPVQLPDIPARLDFHHLKENHFAAAGLRIFWEYTYHSSASVAYRLEVNGKKIVYMSDNEFLKNYTGPVEGLGLSSREVQPYARLIQFAQGADILISECQYLDDEYAKKVGWGHSSLSNACLFVKLAEVKKWIVTHHDPLHGDAFLDQKSTLTRKILESLGARAELVYAADGYREDLRK